MNRRHADFQSAALPTELSRHGFKINDSELVQASPKFYIIVSTLCYDVKLINKKYCLLGKKITLFIHVAVGNAGFQQVIISF